MIAHMSATKKCLLHRDCVCAEQAREAGFIRASKPVRMGVAQRLFSLIDHERR